MNVDGSTLCSMFSIFNTGKKSGETKLNEDAVLKLRNKLDSDHMCFLILDEVSTIDSRIIAMLDFRLKQVFDN